MAVSNTQIVWFKRDLRIADHAALCAAAEAGPVLPLYIIEPDYWAQPDVSGRQYAFLLDCLRDLHEALAGQGVPLRIETGEAVEVLARVQSETGATALWSHEETGNAWTFARDIRVGEWARSSGVAWQELSQCGVIRRLKSRNGWAERWDRRMAQPRLETPALTAAGPGGGEPPLADRLGLTTDACPQRQAGGRATGLAVLDSFLKARGEPYRSAMSSPLEGAEHCSRLSPHIALGTLSVREVAQAGWSRQAALKTQGGSAQWRRSMRSFSSRLHWRDHFMQKLEDEPEIETRNMHPGLEDLRPDTPDPARLDAWIKGETGIPFIDACMRCLQATGWMNFRMRAMLVSFASYHLWQPWQASGTLLARAFTDYEPGIHWPQVQMQSGTTGVNAIRIYNPVKQGHDQDPDGVFTRRWLPELAEVPDACLQEPWRWSEAGRVLGRTYPDPVIDLAEAARAARDRVFSARRSDGFKQASQSVLARHGSRAPSPRRRRRSKPAQADPGQLTLGL